MRRGGSGMRIWRARGMALGSFGGICLRGKTGGEEEEEEDAFEKMVLS